MDLYKHRSENETYKTSSYRWQYNLYLMIYRLVLETNSISLCKYCNENEIYTIYLETLTQTVFKIYGR